MTFGSKYFGWLASLLIVLIAGWYLLPSGYNTLIAWLSPELGNYVRPTMVMVNAVLVNPMNNIVMVAIWGVAGFVGGAIAGTKKGAFVVGLFTWLSVVLILVFCVFQLITTGIDLGNLPPMPPGTSITDLLGIPLVQSIIGELLTLLGGISGGGGGLNIMSVLTPLLIWLFTPVIVVIVAAIIGASVRPKE